MSAFNEAPSCETCNEMPGLCSCETTTQGCIDIMPTNYYRTELPELEQETFMAPYKHRCVMEARFRASLAGNKRSQDVSPSDIEYQSTCNNCGELLASPEQIVAYIYAQLTGL